MARKCLTTVVVCLLASTVAAQVIADEKKTLEEAFFGSRKGLGRLERMLQIETEPEPEPKEPTGTSCGPAALTDRTDCAAPVTSDQPAPTVTTTTSKPSEEGRQQTCTGPDCLEAPMPGQVGAPNHAASDAAAQAPQTRPLTYGPMTSTAFDRMVAKKRAAVRAQVEAAGGMDGMLKTFMEAHADPFKEAAALKVPRHASDEAGIPIPSASSASSGSSKQQQPPPVRRDFEMRFAAEAPAMAPANDEEAEEAAKLAVQAAARKAGLGRKRLAAQAGRLLDRQAALSAAMQAKQSGADYKTMPAASRSGFAGRGPREPRIEVEAHVMPGASRPASELPDADRVPDSLLRPKPQPQQQPETAAATEQTAASEAAAPHHAVYKLQLQQRIQADQAAQARSWAALDYACAALLLMVAPVAVFLAAAVMEDVFLRSTGAAPSVPSTSSSASWSELPEQEALAAITSHATGVADLTEFNNAFWGRTGPRREGPNGQTAVPTTTIISQQAAAS
eukprot:XP_001690464.1 predicted protein [Chlamydomonas reinhardtii]